MMLFPCLILVWQFQEGEAFGMDTPKRSKEVLSTTYTIDRLYKSMQGPQSTEKILLGKTIETPELLWITGYRANMVGFDGHTPQSQEFMCHSNLDIDMSQHRKLFKWKKTSSNRLFTLSQGQFEIAFPGGFGIPVMSNEVFSLTTQALNLNIEEANLKVRHKVTIDYVKDKDLHEPMKPLFMKAANGLVLVEGPDGYYNVEQPIEEVHGPGCLVGEGVSTRYRLDKFGRKFSGHWIVKPGREINKTLVTKWMNLPFDTRVHYIAVHLHPFAESLELKDLTDGITIFKSKVRSSPDKIGIDAVEYYSSVEGIPFFKDHEYELTSHYHNTTDKNQDSMAVMFLYLLDKEFQDIQLSDIN